MSYSVKLTDNAEEELKDILRHWPVAAAHKDAIAQLRLLGKEPNLGRRVPEGLLRGRMAYTFHVARPPLVKRLTAYYLYGQDEETLWITQVIEGDPHPDVA